MKAKLLAAVLAGSLVLSLAACGSSSSDSSDTSSEEVTEAEEEAEEEVEAEEETAEEAEEEEAEAEEETAEEAEEGETLTGVGSGFGGDITVTLTLEGDTITACSIEGPDETEDVGGAALEELAEQVVAANGADIDGVSGATFTSNGVSEAVLDALGLSEEEEAEEEETLTGVGSGFGGDITVTLTLAGDTITACSIEGPDETEDVGGAALEELAKQVVAANGADIDGVSGATFTSNGVSEAVLDALGLSEEEEAEEAEEEVEEEEEEEIVYVEDGISIGMVYGAATGTSSFSYAIVALQEDTIVALYVDEFRFGSTDDDLIGVPNSDGDLGEYFAEGTILYSKRVNNDYYSENMAAAGATETIDNNLSALEAYVVGMTIDEVEEAAADEDVVDAISGATLLYTNDYLDLIADAAKEAQSNQAVAYDGDVTDLTLNVVYGAAHGTKCFTIGAALTDGETIVLAYLDELQFLPSSDAEGVPNSDDELGENFTNDYVLASKRVNTEYYSSLLTASAGSETPYEDNLDAIQDYIAGMSIEEAEELAADENAVDAVTGATLTDTANYVGVIAEAAQQ